MSTLPRTCVAALVISLALPSCLLIGGSTNSSTTERRSASAPARPRGYASSVTEHLEFDALGWSRPFQVADPELAFEINAVRSTSDAVDLWLIEPEGHLRLLCPASLMHDDLPTLVVPPGAQVRAKRVLGEAASTDLLLSGRVVRR